ncbi:MAG: HAMP domain-containing protein, partial [Bdellovibrionales bacterium]|nr:HAMP domain-containing protein [Bdellovibrionales bacterium]
MSVTAVLTVALVTSWQIGSLFGRVSAAEKQSQQAQLQAKAATYSATIGNAFRLAFSSLDYSTLHNLIADTATSDDQIRSITIAAKETGLVISADQDIRILQKVDVSGPLGGLVRIQDEEARPVFRAESLLAYEDKEYVLRIDFDSQGFDQAMAQIQKEHESKQAESLILALGFIGALLLGTYLLSQRIGRWVGRPLRELTSAAENIAGGEYDHPLSLDRDDEIGDLGQSFEIMRQNIV